MSNLRSTIKLESTGTFPADISLTSNTRNNIEGSVNFGNTKVINDFIFETSNLLTPQPIGRKGATIYAESPSSNGRVIALYTIQALDNWVSSIFIGNPFTLSTGPAPFARLKPGDSMFQHLPYEAVGIVAILESGLDNFSFFGPGAIEEGDTETASLNYFVGDNGISNGATAAYLQRGYNSYLEYDSYQVRVMDVNTGKQTALVDLELDYDGGLGWDFNDWIVTQNKGYSMTFTNSDTGNMTVVNLTSLGLVTKAVDDESGVDDYNLDGRGTMFTWQDGSNRRFRLFDGEITENYTIECTGYNWETSWDDSSSTGAVVVTAFDVEGYTGYDVTYLLSKGEATILWENRSALTGVISSSIANNAVFGLGTKFTTEVRVGDEIYWDVDVLLGTVGLINNDTSLELVANATADTTNEVSKVQHIGISDSFYSYEFGKTIVHVIYDVTNSKYKRLTVWNDDGVKLKEVDLSPMLLNYFSFDFYGTDRFQVVARANAVGGDTDWRLFAYDATTNILHGKDGDWIESFSEHPVFATYSYNKNLGSTSNFSRSIDPETMVVAFYDEIESYAYAFINQRSSHLTWEVLFPGESDYNTYDLTVGPGNTVWWRYVDGYYTSATYPTPNHVHFATSSINDRTGNLIANTIIPGATAIVQTTIADLSAIVNRSTNDYTDYGFYAIGNADGSIESKVLTGIGTTWFDNVAPGYALYDPNFGTDIGTVASVDSNTQITLVENSTLDFTGLPLNVSIAPSALHYVAFGDYAFYAYYKPATGTTVFAVLDKSGKLVDTLEVTGTKTYDDVWVHQYNSLLIRYFSDDAAPDRNWYFNAASKKFVEIPEFYGYYDTPDFGFSNGVNPGVIGLNNDNNNWRILSPNAISPNISIPGKYDPFNINYWMGENYLFIEFEDDEVPFTYYMLVYDLGGNLVNTVQTLYQGDDGSTAYGDRMAKYYYDSYTGGPDAYALITPTSVEYAYDVADNFWTAQNDWEWQQDYWC